MQTCILVNELVESKTFHLHLVTHLEFTQCCIIIGDSLIRCTLCRFQFVNQNKTTMIIFPCGSRYYLDMTNRCNVVRWRRRAVRGGGAAGLWRCAAGRCCACWRPRGPRRRRAACTACASRDPRATPQAVCRPTFVQPPAPAPPVGACAAAAPRDHPAETAFPTPRMPR